MPKLSRKQMSVEHEEYVAKMLDGKRERASGASITAPGSVTPTHLIECKVSESGTLDQRKAVAQDPRGSSYTRASSDGRAKVERSVQQGQAHRCDRATR
jgi:hypothetical protein